MIFRFEERPSDSPLVERVWRARSERVGSFTSLASSHRELIVARIDGHLRLTLRAPETRATTAHCAVEGEWVGIILKLGAHVPHLGDGARPDSALDLPEATDRTFWLAGAAWEYPTYDHADTFVARLVRAGLLVRDPVVAAALEYQPQELSPRSLQRHFVRATGLPHGGIRQIERARHAATLLLGGLPILETAARAGYADQAHLTRALKRFIGQTPARLLGPDRDDAMSLLFKTADQPDAMLDAEPVSAHGGRARE